MKNIIDTVYLMDGLYIKHFQSKALTANAVYRKVQFLNIRMVKDSTFRKFYNRPHNYASELSYAVLNACMDFGLC